MDGGRETGGVVRSILEDRLQAALAAIGQAQFPGRVGQATDARFGDYQTNAAMLLAKELRSNPREIAGRLIAAIDVDAICEKPEIAGAGFINFRLLPGFVARRLVAMAADPRLGVPRARKPLRIVIDFSAPNVAKPMHVGHIRSTILGDTLTRVARFLEHDVVTDNHIGDWGTQFGKVIHGWKHFLDDEALAGDAVGELVRLYRKVNSLADEDPQVLEACRLELVKLQQGDPENLGIWTKAVDLSKHAFDAIYQALDIRFNETLGESFYNDRLAPLAARLEREGLARVSDGALCIFFPDIPELADKPCLIRKSDGGFLYATTDLATLEYRVERWHPDAIWYVTGMPQQLHFQQVFAAARMMGIAADLRHVAFGSILGDDRKLMKTRSGENVQLGDLLTEACDRAFKLVDGKNPAMPPDEKRAIARITGLGAVKYAELSQHRLTDYVFSWDKMLSLQGNTAPYLQNAYVRIQSIFRKGGEEPAGGGPPGLPERVGLRDPAELALAKRLLQYGETVPGVLDDFRPNLLANHLYELANTFHAFYEACPVLKADGDSRALRLGLCDLTARVLKHGLALLGIGVPDRM